MLFQYLLLAGLTVGLVAADESDTVKLVSIIFRHGQRTPASTYPTDPHLNSTFAPYGWGQLTNEGKNQQYDQGRWLRNRYDRFLGRKYYENLLEAMTTDVDRTKMSCALMFAGLLPPVGDQIWNNRLMWQPIPTSHQKLSEDKLLLVRGCSRYSEALKEVMESEEVKRVLEDEQDLYRYLSQYAGVKVTDPYGVEDIYSTLKAEEDINLPIPEWTRRVYPDKMRESTAFSFQLNVWTKEMKKIKGGPLLKKIIQDMQSKVDNKLPRGRKLYVYAGHDSTVVNVLSALNVWEKQIPVYNIMAIFELHEINGEHSVKVFLRNNTQTLYELNVPGCHGSPCPLRTFQHVTADSVPDKLENVCKCQSNECGPVVDSPP